MKMKHIAAVLLVILSLVTVAQAGRIWVHTPIQTFGSQNPINVSRSALAMRMDDIWPAVVYAGAEPGTALMTPLGWLDGPQFSTDATFVAAAAGTQGNVAFTTDAGDVMTYGTQGWASLGAVDGLGQSNRPSLVYNNSDQVTMLSRENNQLGISSYNGYGWNVDVIEANQQYYDSKIASHVYDNNGNAHVAFYDGGQLSYGMKGSATGNNWIVGETNLSPQFNVMDMDMALTSNDVPWLAYGHDNGMLNVATYDRQTGMWVNTFTASMFAPKTFSLATDADGNVAVAYSDDNEDLHFAFNDGSGWVDELIAIHSTFPSLAFDEVGNPVISYHDSNANTLSLAYDPVEVPEPTTMLLLGAALPLLRRRR